MALPKGKFSEEEARATAAKLGIDWATADFGLEDFLDGMNVELEHGLIDPQTNCTNDDPVMTAKIALAHLKEGGKYYELLEGLEKELEEKKEMKEMKHEAEEIGMKIRAANKLRAKINDHPCDIY